MGITALIMILSNITGWAKLYEKIRSEKDLLTIPDDKKRAIAFVS